MAKTGWPPGMLQDDDRKLSRWFASRPGARYQVDKNCADMRLATTVNNGTIELINTNGAQDEQTRMESR